MIFLRVMVVGCILAMSLHAQLLWANEIKKHLWAQTHDVTQRLFAVECVRINPGNIGIDVPVESEWFAHFSDYSQGTGHISTELTALTGRCEMSCEPQNSSAGVGGVATPCDVL